MKPLDPKAKTKLSRTYIRVNAWNDWFFRVLGRGFSVQPITSEYHKHLFSTRHAKIQPLHLFNLCWRTLK